MDRDLIEASCDELKAQMDIISGLDEEIQHDLEDSPLENDIQEAASRRLLIKSAFVKRKEL